MKPKKWMNINFIIIDILYSYLLIYKTSEFLKILIVIIYKTS